MSTGNELLADIQHVFESKQVGKMKTADLIAELVSDEEKSWATYNRGRPLTPRQLAKLLSGYLRPKTVRFGSRTPKGYEASQFTDAFARYLADPEDLSQRRNDSPESNGDMTGGVADTENVAATPTSEETQGLVTTLDCGGVADISGDADGTGAPTPSGNLEDLF